METQNIVKRYLFAVCYNDSCVTNRQFSVYRVADRRCSAGHL